MGCYARCKNCNSNLYLQQQKENLTFPVTITCYACNNSRVYTVYEITQERHDYNCLFCKKSFFIKRSPPISVSCPHCKSDSYINSDGSLNLLRAGTMPAREQDAAGGLVGGAIIGALFGPAGAILGGLLGAALGHSGLSREATYHDGI